MKNDKIIVLTLIVSLLTVQLHAFFVYIPITIVYQATKNFIKETPGHASKIFFAALHKTQTVARQRPLAFTAGIAATGLSTYGFYRLLYWYFPTPDQKYYNNAHRFYHKTNNNYENLITTLNRLSVNKLYPTSDNPDETILSDLAQAKTIPISMEQNQLKRTINKLSSYAKSLKKRSQYLDDKEDLTSEEQRLTFNMKTLRENIKKHQIDPLKKWLEILKIHASFFAVWDKMQCVKLYKDDPAVPKDFVKDTTESFGYLGYVARLSRELSALKEARKQAYGRYINTCNESDQLTAHLKQRIRLIQETQTYKDQLDAHWWYKWRARIDNTKWFCQTFLPSKDK